MIKGVIKNDIVLYEAFLALADLHIKPGNIINNLLFFTILENSNLLRLSQLQRQVGLVSDPQQLKLFLASHKVVLCTVMLPSLPLRRKYARY